MEEFQSHENLNETAGGREKETRFRGHLHSPCGMDHLSKEVLKAAGKDKLTQSF